MYDRFNRKIDYLRISVTDRCDLRCGYCMPPGGIKWLKHSDILSYEEITGITAYLAAHGITKVRLTGGEPLVRKEISKLVKMLSGIEGIVDLSMTTNATLLKKHAYDLKKAGLQRVNISLDTLNPIIFRKITPLGKLEDVMQGIDEAIKTGFAPIKINCVDSRFNSKKDIEDVRRFSDERGLPFRIIKQMDLPGGTFTKVDGGHGGDCPNCNRIRLTSDGKLKPCLFSDLEYDIRKLGIEKALDEALKYKPLHGATNHFNSFNQMGG